MFQLEEAAGEQWRSQLAKYEKPSVYDAGQSQGRGQGEGRDKDEILKSARCGMARAGLVMLARSTRTHLHAGLDGMLYDRRL